MPKPNLYQTDSFNNCDDSLSQDRDGPNLDYTSVIQWLQSFGEICWAAHLKCRLCGASEVSHTHVNLTSTHKRPKLWDMY